MEGKYAKEPKRDGEPIKDANSENNKPLKFEIIYLKHKCNSVFIKKNYCLFFECTSSKDNDPHHPILVYNSDFGLI